MLSGRGAASTPEPEFQMKRRPGIGFSPRTREGIIRDLLAKAKVADLGDSHPDNFGGDVKTQAEIAEDWHVSVSTVTKMAIDLDERLKAKEDPFDFS